MRKLLRNLFFITSIICISPFPILVAKAGYYDAICNGTKCTLIIDSDSIKSPYGIIPLSRVTS